MGAGAKKYVKGKTEEPTDYPARGREGTLSRPLTREAIAHEYFYFRALFLLRYSQWKLLRRVWRRTSFLLQSYIFLLQRHILVVQNGNSKRKKKLLLHGKPAVLNSHKYNSGRGFRRNSCDSFCRFRRFIFGVFFKRVYPSLDLYCTVVC